MHPILGQFRRLLLYLAAWGPISAILVYLFGSLGGPGGHDLGRGSLVCVAVATRDHEPAQERIVRADSFENALPDYRTAGQQGWRGNLHRSRNGQVRVADQLESLQRLRHERLGPIDRNPSELHLRQAN